MWNELFGACGSKRVIERFVAMWLNTETTRSFVCGRAHIHFRIPKVCSVKTIEKKNSQRNRAKERIKEADTLARCWQKWTQSQPAHIFLLFSVSARPGDLIASVCDFFFIRLAPRYTHTHKSYNSSAHLAWLDRTIQANTITCIHTHMLPFFSEWNKQSKIFFFHFLLAKRICMLRWLLISCWGKLDNRLWHTEKEVKKLKIHERCLRCACACISFWCVYVCMRVCVSVRGRWDICAMSMISCVLAAALSHRLIFKHCLADVHCSLQANEHKTDIHTAHQQNHYMCVTKSAADVAVAVASTQRPNSLYKIICVSAANISSRTLHFLPLQKPTNQSYSFLFSHFVVCVRFDRIILSVNWFLLTIFLFAIPSLLICW